MAKKRKIPRVTKAAKKKFTTPVATDEDFEREEQFKNHKGDNVGNVVSYLKNYMKYKHNTRYDIFIGCDSQVNRNNTVYSVVIGIHTIVDGIGRGVHIVHTREKDRKYNEDRGAIFKRLWSEVTRIVETAMYLRENGIETKDIGTHIDANVKKEFASNMIYDSAIGYLNSLGFKVEGKPYAWAATYAANRYCRS